MTPKLYSRNISDNEQLYIHLQEAFSSFAIHLVVEGEGEIDPDALQIAVEKASEACPGARLIQSNGRWVDSQCTPPVHLRNGQLLNKVLEEKMDPHKGPTSEVIILQLNPMILVFRVFHGTMDGKGALLWINNIFKALRGEKLVAIEGKETDLSFLKQQESYSKRQNLTFDVCAINQRFSVRNHKIWRKRLTIPGKPACLVAKIAEIMTRYGTSHNNRFLVPVDIRRHEKTHLSNANLTLPIFLETTKNESWSEIHKNLLNGLQNNQEMNLKNADLGLLIKIPRFMLNWGIRGLTALQRINNKYVLGGVISDLGFIDLAALSTDNFQANTLYSLSIQQPFSPFNVAIASNRNASEITISCYENKILIEYANQIMNAIEDDICSYNSEINRPKQTYPLHKTVMHLIEEQINKAPDSVAMRYDKKTISYSTLGSQTDQIAHHLTQLGVGSGRAVAIFMGRSELLMPLILAILKTGAAYIPLDVESPQHRLNKILKSPDIFACVTEPKLKNQLSSIEKSKIIDISEIDLSCHKVSFTCLAQPNEIAYQMYTSGSTGIPKGVQIEHRSLVNYLLWAKQEYLVSEQSVFPLFASIAFDSTITSMFLPLIAGGSIELYEEKTTLVTLKKIIKSPSITHIKISPAHLQLATQTGYIFSPPKILIVGGEQLNLSLTKKIHDLYGKDWKIINEYGPTEATVGCITYTYNPDHPLDGYAVPIGRPIMNTSVYLLDENRRPVQKGAIGEIYLSGDCLARGYANDPVLTAEKFVILEEGERAYKTGDLAQINDNGNLVYVSRVDDQINTHGNRFEIGEIENAILEFKGITEAAVIVKKNNLGKTVLVAFYSVESVIDESSLKKHLQDFLPHYVQVHFFVCLNELPLTIHHKIDKQALPLPNININLRKEDDVVEILNLQEQILMEIWREVLQLNKDFHIKLTDSFYDLGGDSLGMLIVLNKISARLLDGPEHEVLFMNKMGNVVQAPTIQNFSRAILTIKDLSVE